MFDALTDKLGKVFDGLTGRGALSEKDVNEALRDIGTGDLTVGKKIRKMGEAFYGRAKAYDEALSKQGEEIELQHSLVRNLGLADTEMERFGRYVRLVEATLKLWPRPLATGWFVREGPPDDLRGRAAAAPAALSLCDEETSDAHGL